jgi:putative transposase
MRRTPFVTGEHYHVYNRGVDKRIIFSDDQDYKYFLDILTLFNSKKPVLNVRKKISRAKKLGKYRGETSIPTMSAPIVEILNFSLMPNHFHLLLRQLVTGGISKFLQKIGTGYTMYFNARNDRTGVLFQGVAKSKHIDTDRYFRYLEQYIDLNPIDLIESRWKEKGIKNKKRTLSFLENYPWNKRKDYSKYKRELSRFKIIDEYHITAEK